MTPERWSQIREVFGQALEIAGPERRQFLDVTCNGDADLRVLVERLLKEHTEPSWESPAATLLPSLSLRPSAQIANYRIDAALGKGGMGMVYKAHDTKLEREVALKILRSETFDRPGERLLKEARAASALNHPNIVTIYEVGRASGVDFISMELVEGHSLAAEIGGEALLRERVVDLAEQIAGALQAAHEKGIIHRDLKPANIMVTAGGVVKVLDFGLARAAGEQTDGVFAGTPSYMSPEQAEGRITDQRTDIWAFGCVLYEALTGNRAFKGETTEQIFDAIAKAQPDLSAVPIEARRLVEHCLKKDPRQRLQAIGDWRLLLDEAAPADSADTRRLQWSWLAALVVLAVTAAIGWIWRPEVVPVRDVSFTIPPPAGKELWPVGWLGVDQISPNGSMILSRTSDRRYFVRRLNSFENDLLPSWLGAGAPCWSPDSQSIAFPVFGGQLMKMGVPKGAPELISQNLSGFARGASWSEKGIILLAQSGAGLFTVPAAGGTPQRVKVSGLEEGGNYLNPVFLSGGEDFLFEFHPLDFDGAQVYIATLLGGEAVDLRLLFTNDTAVSFTPSGGGHILYVKNDNLYSRKLDRKGRKLIGDPELVQEHVVSYGDFWKIANFSVSNAGTLAWRSGSAMVSHVTVFDRKGNRTGVAGTPGGIGAIVRLSPDESRLIAPSAAGVWIMDANGPGRTNIHLARRNDSPFWSADSAGLIFEARDGAKVKLFERPLSDSGDKRELREIPLYRPGGGGIIEVSRDRRRFLFSDATALSWFSLDGKGMERIVDHRVDDAGFSPDGTWLVYRMAGLDGLYARPVAGVHVPIQLSDRGFAAVWRADGKEILYEDAQGIWSVAVAGLGDALRFAAPVMLFHAGQAAGLTSSSRTLAVSRDGSRIFHVQSPEQPDSGVIRVRTVAIQ